MSLTNVSLTAHEITGKIITNGQETICNAAVYRKSSTIGLFN